MTPFDAFCAAALASAMAAAGTVAVSLPGGETVSGTLDHTSQSRELLQDGGFGEQVDASVLIQLPDFVAAWPAPAEQLEGKRVVVGGIARRVSKVDADAISITIHLSTVRQGKK